MLCLVTQSYPTHWDPMDCSPSGSFSMGSLPARILEWVAMPSFPSQGSNPWLPHCRRILYVWATRKAQFILVTQSSLTLCNPMDCSIQGFPVHHHLKPMSIESIMTSKHLILCCPLLLSPSIFPSIWYLNKSILCIRWPKYWSFSFSISPSNVYLRLISFRIDYLDLLAVQGTFKSLLQHYSSKASILQCSAFFTV